MQLDDINKVTGSILIKLLNHLEKSYFLIEKRFQFRNKVYCFKMEESRVYNLNEFIRTQRKEEIKKKQRKCQSKSSKINNFRNSIGKLFRIKSQSEKSLKCEDHIDQMVPSAIYLSPNSSLPRETKSINNSQFNQNAMRINNPGRHSCSDFSCRRSNTFCIYENCLENNKSDQNLKSNQGLISPPISAFYHINLEELDENKLQSSNPSVPHSKSVPLQLSQSQQNLNPSKKSITDVPCTAKRNARKKSIFNCSLFRKRSNSRSKSTDKIHQQKPLMGKCFEKSKHLSQLNDEPSNLSDRCLTLPNLKSSEIDLTSHVNNPLLLSIDLIKDYLNRSDNALSTSVQRNSVETSSYYQYNPKNHSSVSVQNSPLLLPSRNSVNELRNFDNSKLILYESLKTENATQNPSFEAKSTVTSAYDDVYSGMSVTNCALDNIIYKNSLDMNKFVQNNNRPQFSRQISAPHYISRPTINRLPHAIHPPTGAVEFWTRPYQEKIKASRRRLLDDKVGSKEALLRSMSPQNIRLYEGESIYDTSYHLQMIPEPPNSVFIEKCDNQNLTKSYGEGMIKSNSFYTSIAQDFHSSSLMNPKIENRLSESPIEKVKRQDPIGKVHTNNYIDLGESQAVGFKIIEDSKSRISPDSYHISNFLSKNQLDIQEDQKIKPFYVKNEHNFGDSLSLNRDLRSIRSSTEVISTRTPTPPHSFAESSLSSAPPVPKEFLNESSQSISKPGHHCGNVNPLYSSDNSSESREEFAELDHDFVIPVPPPRTDSVIRSMQFQQNNDPDKSELEYDIADEFFPIFSGSNIDKCDIEQYHKWLEKLPYKLSEFPEILHSRKSAVTAKKSIQNEELVDIVPERIGILELKHLKLYRKSIKSWNMSDSSKADYEPTNDTSHRRLSNESSSMKKSFSCDHSLHNSDHAPSTDELDRQVNLSQNLPTTETTLLRQYSHLYSLKLSPSHNNVVNTIQSSSSVLKTTRSKSIDLRNFISSNKSQPLFHSTDCSENRKSAPNTKFIWKRN